jgi:hypothetical protein
MICSLVRVQIGEPRHRKVPDIAAERAARQQRARNVVEPETLTEIVKLLCGVHDNSYYVQSALWRPSKAGKS